MNPILIGGTNAGIRLVIDPERSAIDLPQRAIIKTPEGTGVIRLSEHEVYRRETLTIEGEAIPIYIEAGMSTREAVLTLIDCYHTVYGKRLQ